MIYVIHNFNYLWLLMIINEKKINIIDINIINMINIKTIND